MTTITLNADGLHCSDYTREVAQAVAEGMRVLNYATRDGEDGLEFPADVASVAGEICTAAERLDQLTRQLGDYLAKQQSDGKLRVTHGPYEGYPEQAVAAAQASLDQALEAAQYLAFAWRVVHSTTSTISF
ncbi:hypothetical protein ACU635_43530 [[Actinomadura] parvosata]|uniref:hypothetical protein n=1 Tax=[Actinomadura] parvosata TaxID=1955412 RepID=UPI00406C41DE